MHSDKIQIWNTATGACEKEWKWNRQILPLPQDYTWKMDIIPFSDSIHFLVHLNYQLYIFNLYNNNVQAVSTDGEIEFFSKCHILPHGNILTCENALPEGTFTLCKYQTPEIVRSNQFRLRQLATEFVLNKKLPNEIISAICFFAFPKTDHLK